ncbi:ABC transporter permease [Massilia sp. Root335]|uniref:ABC transporter permease n=1 Tax=Massilia sp. Root335 TaxID=1736517 RepID=UPI0006F74399|nr:ABC transporter permease [Massilia sp. Root335]KQV27032.1 branched-chain amino acid ABC transporter permease [Massilia sp. Root335]
MNLLKQREPLLAAMVVLLVVAVGLKEPAFLSADSLANVVTDSTLLVMLALTQMLVIVTRGVDLSVASNLALSGMVAAMLGAHYPGMPLALIMLAAVAVGLGLGLVNGWLIGRLELPPIVVTLGTMSVYRGAVFVLSGGAWVSAHQMPPHFIAFPLDRLLGLPHLVWIAAATLAALAWVARSTRFGRDLYAIGNAPQCAGYIGIPTHKRLLWTYALSGAVAGLCGYLWVARYAVAYTEIAYGFEFTVIAACVIGGVSIGGGVGTVLGATLGALFLTVIGNALPVLQVSPFWQSALTGLVILVAVLINARGAGRRSRQILPLHGTAAPTHRSAA